MISDILILRCPIDNEIKFVGTAKNGHLKLSVSKYFRDYYRWRALLKKEKKEPLIEIIDSVDSNQAVFFQEFYADLYRSWGFELLDRKSEVQYQRPYRKRKYDPITDIRGLNNIISSVMMSYSEKAPNIKKATISCHYITTFERPSDQLIISLVETISSLKKSIRIEDRPLFYELPIFLIYHILMENPYNSLNETTWDNYDFNPKSLDIAEHERNKLLGIWSEIRSYLDGRDLNYSFYSDLTVLFRYLFVHFPFEENAIHSIIDLLNRLANHFLLGIRFTFKEV